MPAERNQGALSISMGFKVSVLLDQELSRRYKRALMDAATRHGHTIVSKDDAELIVTDRPLASATWLTVNIAAEGQEEVPRYVERVTRLFEQLGASRARQAPAQGGPQDPTRATRLNETFRLGDGEVDRGRSRFVRGEVEAKLTAIELSLIERLHAARGSFVSRSTLEREVWGYAETVQSRTVLSTIHRLRQKVELDPSRPTLILSDRHRGYRLSWEDESNLRRDRTLIGRDDLMVDISRRIDSPAGSRIVTLTGPSGIGKTYFARHLATVLGRRRALWCDCSGIQSAPTLVLALARTLDCRGAEQKRLWVLGHALAAREDVVLFLDDLELTDPELRELVAALSDQAPRARVIITSREVGAMRGSHVELGALDDKAAREMLSLRRGHLFPDAPLSDEELVRLVDVCQGLPLFLELAAREPTLTGALSPQPAATSWGEVAWVSLSDEARYLVGALALLPAGFHFEAVESLVKNGGAAFPPFTELVTRSLIVDLGPERYARKKVDLERERESRFTVLSHIRELALARERGAMLSAALWLAERAERWARGLEGDGAAFGEAMAGFMAEEVNLSFAARRVAEFEPATAERIVLALGNFLIMRGPLSEALELTRLVRSVGDTPRLRFLEARASTLMGQPGPAIELLRGLADDDDVGDRVARARVYDALASLLSQGPEYEHCRATAAALFGDSELGAAEMHESELAALFAQDRLEEALAETLAALAIFERHACWRRAIALRINRGSLLRDLGRLDEAEPILESARADAEARGYGLAQRYAELNLAFLVLDQALVQRRTAARADEFGARLAKAREHFEHLHLAARRHGKMVLAARAGVWGALLSEDPLSRRAKLEVALSLALEVGDAEASAIAIAELGRAERTAGPLEPSLDSLMEQLPPLRRRAVLRLAGRLEGEPEDSNNTHWRAACWLASRF